MKEGTAQVVAGRVHAHGIAEGPKRFKEPGVRFGGGWIVSSPVVPVADIVQTVCPGVEISGFLIDLRCLLEARQRKRGISQPAGQKSQRAYRQTNAPFFAGP